MIIIDWKGFQHSVQLQNNGINQQVVVAVHHLKALWIIPSSYSSPWCPRYPVGSLHSRDWYVHSDPGHKTHPHVVTVLCNCITRGSYMEKKGNTWARDPLNDMVRLYFITRVQHHNDDQNNKVGYNETLWIDTKISSCSQSCNKDHLLGYSQKLGPDAACNQWRDVTVERWIVCWI